MSKNKGKSSHGSGGGGSGSKPPNNGKPAPTTGTTSKATGACSELGTHVFDYGKPESAEQMVNTWEHMETYVGKEYNEDIKNELSTGRETVIPEPVLPDNLQKARDNFQANYKLRNNNRLDAKRKAEAAIAEELTKAEAASTKDNQLIADLAVKLADLQNDIAVLEDKLDNPPEPDLGKEDGAKYSGDWKTYNVRKAKLEEYRGKLCSLILGQCTQVLKDKLKQDPEYVSVIQSGKPLRYKALIERTIMAQSSDQFSCAVVHQQLCGVLGFRQGTNSNAQYYQRFNTRVDVSRAVGVNWVHEGVTKHLAQELFKKDLHQLSTDEFKEVRDKASEQLLSYIFIDNSSHTPLKLSLKNGFATGHEDYPDNRTDALRMLNNFSQPPQPSQEVSQGASFGQVSEAKPTRPYNKAKWKHQVCWGCGEEGHPIWSHTEEEQKQFALERKKNSKQKDTKSTKKDDSDGESDKGSKAPKKKSTGKKGGGKKKAIEEAAALFAAHMIEYMEGQVNDEDEESSDNEASH